MDLKQLRDFLVLAEIGNFSRAAERRHVTQPAFSRRIRALETWAGRDLFDRRIQPVRLTEAGQRFRERAEEIVRQIDGLRGQVRDNCGGPGFVAVAAQHSIAAAYVPGWIAQAQDAVGPLRARVISDDLHGCLDRVGAGECDFAMVFHHDRFPVALDRNLMQSIVLAHTFLTPYSAPSDQGAPRHRLPAAGRVEAPVLAYSPGAALAHLMDGVLHANDAVLDRVACENSLADALRTLAISGHGIAWLPEILVAPDIEAGRLVEAGSARWRAELSILMVRREDRMSSASRRLWNVFARLAEAA
jgi:DNA-binding transcriptional LysR family regulator